MQHPALGFLEDRIKLLQGLTSFESKLGIFYKNGQRIDFIWPLYNPSDSQEKSAVELSLRIKPGNPILALYFDLNLRKLKSMGKTSNGYVFTVDLTDIEPQYINDGNPEYLKYRANLKKAKFEIA